MVVSIKIEIVLSLIWIFWLSKKKKSVLRRSKQAANLMKQIWDPWKQDVINKISWCFRQLSLKLFFCTNFGFICRTARLELEVKKVLSPVLSFYIQLLYKPHLGTWILPFGLLGSKRKISETTEFLLKQATFWGGFFNFLWPKKKS